MRACYQLFVSALAVSLVSTGQSLAQQGGRGGVGFAPGAAQLVQSKTVREDLKLSADQATKLTGWAKEQQGKMREKLQGVPREEMFAKYAELQKEATKEVAGVLKPEQMKRLKQIEFQMAGLRGLSNPETAKELNVTDDQKEKIKSVMQDVGKEMRDLNEEYGVNFGRRPSDPDKAKEFDKKSAMLTKDATSKVMAVMTDDQKKAYKSMAGESIDVSKVRTEVFSGMGGGRGKKKDDN